jgi:hypothetical protein
MVLRPYQVRRPIVCLPGVATRNADKHAWCGYGLLPGYGLRHNGFFCSKCLLGALGGGVHGGLLAGCIRR